MHPAQPVYVLRVATYNEYRDYCFEINGGKNLASPTIFPYHYEVSVD